jgi:hypothetical protein
MARGADLMQGASPLQLPSEFCVRTFNKVVDRF